LMARAFLFFDGQVQSLAQHTHVGSSPIVGPFFLDKFQALCFSPSPIGYTESFSLSLGRAPPSELPGCTPTLSYHPLRSFLQVSSRSALGSFRGLTKLVFNFPRAAILRPLGLRLPLALL
jgi:hypothetical protein